MHYCHITRTWLHLRKETDTLILPSSLLFLPSTVGLLLTISMTAAAPTAATLPIRSHLISFILTGSSCRLRPLQKLAHTHCRKVRDSRPCMLMDIWLSISKDEIVQTGRRPGRTIIHRERVLVGGLSNRLETKRRDQPEYQSSTPSTVVWNLRKEVVSDGTSDLTSHLNKSTSPLITESFRTLWRPEQWRPRITHILA